MVHYLCRTGVVVPSVRGSTGRGRRRLYDFSDLLLLRALHRLLSQGISVSKLKRVQKEFRLRTKGRPDALLPARYLKTDGYGVYFEEKPTLLVDLASGGQLAFAFVVDMEPIQRDLVASIAELPLSKKQKRKNQ